MPEELKIIEIKYSENKIVCSVFYKLDDSMYLLMGRSQTIERIINMPIDELKNIIRIHPELPKRFKWMIRDDTKENLLESDIFVYRVPMNDFYNIFNFKNPPCLDPSDLENICTLPLEIKRYRDALRKFTETHPDELPEDGFPIVPYTDANIGPHTFMCPSDWLGKVIKITWKSDGDYHGIDKATVKCFPNQYIKFLKDASIMKHLKLIPVMAGSIIGDKTKEFNVQRLIGFMLSE